MNLGAITALGAALVLAARRIARIRPRERIAPGPLAGRFEDEILELAPLPQADRPLPPNFITLGDAANNVVTNLRRTT